MELYSFPLRYIEAVLVAATIVQIAAIWEHYRMARWTWVTPFAIYCVVFATMLIPRVLSQLILYDLIPPGHARLWSAGIFLLDSVLLLIAGYKLRHRITRDIAAIPHPQCVIEIDSDGCIKFVNKAMCDLLGYQRKQLMIQPIQMIMPERYRARHAAAFHKYVISRKRTLDWSRLPQFSVLRSDGSEVPVEITFTEFTWLAASNRRMGERLFRGVIRRVEVVGDR